MATSISIERRSWPRISPGALGHDLLILDESQKRMVPAKLLDIGTGGALIRSDAIIASDRTVGVLIRDVPELGWIDAEIVRPAGPGEIGLRFIAPFSAEFILAATHDRPRERGECAWSETPYLGDAIPIW